MAAGMVSLGDGVRGYAGTPADGGDATPRRVLLVDIAGRAREALSEAIAATGLVVQSTGDDGDATDKIRTWGPDLVLISLEMIAESGLTTCRRIMQATGAPIMLLSNHDVDATDQRAGAGDAARVAERVMTMLRVHSGTATAQAARLPAPGSREVVEAGPVTLNLAQRSITVRGKRVPIRRLEYDLLLALVQQAGRICTREDLAARLWPRGIPVSDPIDVHVRRLRSKIELDPKRPRHIVTVRTFGFYFDPDGGQDAPGPDQTGPGG